MKIIHAKNYNRIPWNNGAGFTADIALSKLNEPFWRLSLAEMPTDAPFSLFPKLSRILTVVQGAGLKLVSKENTIDAPFEIPTSFSGSVQITGVLMSGPVQNLNLVFDETRFRASVVIADANEMLNAQNGGICAAFLLSGSASLDGEVARAGDVLLARAKISPVKISKNARAVVISLGQIET